MTRDEYLRDNPIDAVCASRGIKLIGQGNERKAKCPLHADKNPSFSVNIRKGVWTCYAGCGGGSVIDLLCKLDSISIKEFFAHNGISKSAEESRPLFKPSSTSAFKPSNEKASAFKREQPERDAKIETTYSYLDELGRELYQVVRFKPKDFKQRHKEDGEWVWNMSDCRRVLYHLPELLSSPTVWCVEGEKDANNMVSLGFMATTNVGGSGKWLDSYSESLQGKDVVICGDNDEGRKDSSNPGQDHVRAIFDSIAGKAKTVRIVRLPKGVKDVSDFIATFKKKEDAKRALEDLRDAAHSFVQGFEMPIYSMAEINPILRKHFQHFEENAFHLSKWLPGLKVVGPLIPGDMVVILGHTGGGKTGLATSLALAALPLPTLFFELELSIERMGVRAISTRTKSTRDEVRAAYVSGNGPSDEDMLYHFPKLFICPKPKLTVDEVETIIMRSELKIGSRPRVVVIDYVQLVQGRGERYERMSDAMERLRAVARATQTILIVISQVHRPKEGENEVGKYSGKDSGAIESSASVLLGVWLDEKEANLMHLKVLKCNEGGAGKKILCNFDGERMLITERAQEVETPKPSLRAPKQKPDDSHKPYKED